MHKIIAHLKDNWIQYGFETFVVVFGILVAFSLNNWREEVKIKKEEDVLLQEVLSDMKAARELLIPFIEKHQKGTDHNQSLLKSVEDSLIYSNSYYDSLWRNTTGINLFVTFDPMYGSIRSIITSGKLGYITNQDVTNLISSFEDKVSDVKEAEPVIRKIYFENIFPLAHNYRSPSRFSNRFKPDFDNFPTDKELLTYLTELYYWRRAMLNEEKELLRDIEVLIELIEKELAIKRR